MLASWQPAASGPQTPPCTRWVWAAHGGQCCWNFLDVANFGQQLSTGVRWFKQYTLSNKRRTDRGIWSLLMSLRNQETWVLTLRGMISLRHAPSQRYEKNIHYICHLYFKRDTSVLELFPAIVFKKKRIGCNIITHTWAKKSLYRYNPFDRVDMDFLHRLATLKPCSYINLSWVTYCENMVTGVQHFRYAMFQMLTFPEW